MELWIVSGSAMLPGVSAPAVSVVMPVYNGERFLREAVESILLQTLSDLELIVVDDGSEDSGPQILAGYARRDPRVVVHRQTNLGRATALNRGFGLARAPFVARLDADDVALPERIEQQRQFLAARPSVGVVGGAVVLIDEHSRPFSEANYPVDDLEIRKAFASTTPIVHPAVMVRRDVFHAVGGFRPIFPEAEDVDLWLRMAERCDLANLHQTVIRYRLHPAQATMRRLELQTQCSLAARAAARARREGKPDPVEGLDKIDDRAMAALGIGPEQIMAEWVRVATWLAKASGRAGYRAMEDELFTAAIAGARSPRGSVSLLADVRRNRATRYREQGRNLRAAVERARGALDGLRA